MASGLKVKVLAALSIRNCYLYCALWAGPGRSISNSFLFERHIGCLYKRQARVFEGSHSAFFACFEPNVGENRFFLVWCCSKRQLARGVTKWGKTSGETMVIQFGLVIPRGWGHLEVRPRFSEVSVKRFDTHQASGCFSMKHMDALEIRLQELCFQIALGQNCAARRWMGY